MYKCGICAKVSVPGEPLKKHTVYRKDKSIEREIPVCQGCDHFLKVGIPYEILDRQSGRPIRIVSAKRASRVVANGRH